MRLLLFLFVMAAIHITCQGQRYDTALWKQYTIAKIERSMKGGNRITLVAGSDTVYHYQRYLGKLKENECVLLGKL